MNYFNKIYKLLWIFLILLIMYLSFQRNIKIDGNNKEVVSAFTSSPILSIVTIIFIILLTTITVLRALESRNEWRRIAAEDKVSKKINKIEQQKK